MILLVDLRYPYHCIFLGREGARQEKLTGTQEPNCPPPNSACLVVLFTSLAVQHSIAAAGKELVDLTTRINLHMTSSLPNQEATACLSSSMDATTRDPRSSLTRLTARSSAPTTMITHGLLLCSCMILQGLSNFLGLKMQPLRFLIISPSTNWVHVMQNLDHKGFNIPDEAAFCLLMSIYGCACKCLEYKLEKEKT